jgi:hypothetical protein
MILPGETLARIREFPYLLVAAWAWCSEQTAKPHEIA